MKKNFFNYYLNNLKKKFKSIHSWLIFGLLFLMNLYFFKTNNKTGNISEILLYCFMSIVMFFLYLLVVNLISSYISWKKSKKR